MSTWTHQRYKRGDGQKGSGSHDPVLRITHRVCCEEALETFLPVVNQLIYKPWRDATFVRK